MKYKGVAIPPPSKGVDFSKEEDLVVPDQSMSLVEILKRFTRGEAVPAHHDGTYGNEDHDSPDLEKLANADLVEKQEYAQQLKAKVQQYEKQERTKAAKLKADKDAADEKKLNLRIKREAQKLANEKLAKA